LADYAQNLIERDRFADGMRTYVRISEMFPACTGILSDIGATYYRQGDLGNAEAWVDRAMARGDNDEMTNANAFFIYAVLERNDEALKALVAACKLDGSSEDLLYQGILELGEGKDWRATMKEYAERPNASDKGLVLANGLLNGNPDSLSTYAAVANAGMNDGFMMPVHHLFRDRIGGFAPSFNYAEALGYNHRDREAVVAFDAIPMDGLTQEDREQVLFHKAWSVQQVDGAEAALAVWQPLLTSSNLLYHSAAAYFIGKQKLAKGERDAANDLFRPVADNGNKNKYAMMCAQLLEE
jgi:tetratricopeptide (TPR) repeat protein